MECGRCIFERCRSEGMWDRFGTTFKQELEATCDKHLAEDLKYWTKVTSEESFAYLSPFKQNEEMKLVKLLKQEAERRKIA